MTIFFTSDTHFNHGKIIEYANRPFANIDEMDRSIIKKWNEVVKPDDMIYHLGDVAFCRDYDINYYFEQLNGIIKVLSNPWHHDKHWLPRWKFGTTEYLSKSRYKIELSPPIVVLEFKEFSTNQYPKAIMLCHYQLANWDRKHYGSWHLFGHSHNKAKAEGLSLDVGVDAWDFYPVSLNRVAEILMEKEIQENLNFNQNLLTDSL